MAKSKLDNVIDRMSTAGGVPRERAEKLLADVGEGIIGKAEAAAADRITKEIDKLSGRRAGPGRRPGRKPAAAAGTGE